MALTRPRPRPKPTPTSEPTLIYDNTEDYSNEIEPTPIPRPTQIIDYDDSPYGYDSEYYSIENEPATKTTKMPKMTKWRPRLKGQRGKK